MMKICLIAPQTPFLKSSSFPPLNLLYLASYLRTHNFEDVQLVDLDITKKIPSADVYVITATTPQFPYAEELLPSLEGITIIGGAHPTADPVSCKMFDKVIINDGETAIISCLEDIQRQNNRTKHIYAGTQIRNLDDVPFPARDMIKPNDYRYFIDNRQGTIAMTSRGCPYNCYFCQKRYKNVRMHSTGYVITELENIRECGYEGVYFVDDMFGLRKDLPLLSSHLRKFAWKCQIRPDEQLENIRNLAAMGCREINIGVESGSQKILDIVNKKAALKNVPALVQECKSQGMKVRAYIIVGLPSETHHTIEETKEFLRTIHVDSVGVGTFVPYPGTYIYSNMDQFDIKIEETDYKKWYFRAEKDRYNCVVSTSCLTSEEILEYRNEIDEEFNG